MSANLPIEPWDVPVTLRDLCVEMLDLQRQGASADAETVKRWHHWLYRVSRAHNALAISCEDIVEQGPTPERLEAMKHALTRAMGQTEYWARADRW
jgi:hypothetical protein